MIKLEEKLNMLKLNLFIVVLFIMAGLLVTKLSFGYKATAFESKKKAQKASNVPFGETLDSLEQISASQGVAFIYIPTKKNEKINNQIKMSLLGAQKALKSKNITASIYTIYPNSLEYPPMAAKTRPPAVLTVYKGKGKNYISGIINQTRLLQSYAAAVKNSRIPTKCGCLQK